MPCLTPVILALGKLKQEDQEMKVPWVWGQRELHGEPVVRACHPETEKTLCYYRHPSRILIISTHFTSLKLRCFLMYILMALGCSEGLNCTRRQAHPHLAGRLLHQLPLAFLWVAFHFLGRSSLVDWDRPFPLASGRHLCSLGCQHAAKPISRLSLFSQ